MSTRMSHFARFTEGWASGDADLIFETFADDYTFANPRVGEVKKTDFKS